MFFMFKICIYNFFSVASKPLFNSALWAAELWPLKRLRTSTVIHAAFSAEN